MLIAECVSRVSGSRYTVCRRDLRPWIEATSIILLYPHYNKLLYILQPLSAAVYYMYYKGISPPSGAHYSRRTCLSNVGPHNAATASWHGKVILLLILPLLLYSAFSVRASSWFSKPSTMRADPEDKEYNILYLFRRVDTSASL